MKNKKKVLAALLAVMMAASSNAVVFAEENAEKQSDSIKMTEIQTVQSENIASAKANIRSVSTVSELQKAFTDAADGERIVLSQDIVMTSSDDIVTLPAGKNILFDLNNYAITVGGSFTGRPIKNYGTMKITGNGTINSSASDVGGYGAVDNYGTLTIENGTYTGSVNASGASIKNRPGAVLTIQDGTFNGAVTAVYNEGKTYIYGGLFDCHSCSACNSNSWGYTIQSHWSGSGEKPELYFYNGTVIGVQGAFSTSAGYSEIRNGIFKTVPCEKHSNGSSAFYALYIAGESGEVECNVYGGTFESATKVAAFIGNSNDGGQKKDAVANFYGGSFTSGGNSNTIHVDEKLGGLEITGGTYNTDVSEYIPNTHDELKYSESKFVVGQYTEDQAQQLGMAAKVRSLEGVDFYYMDWNDVKTAAETNKNLTILKDVDETITVPEGTELTIWDDVKVTGNIENNGKLTMRPGAQVVGTISGDGDVTYVKEPSGGGSIGVPGTGIPIGTGTWKQSPAGWWYQNPDGSYPANQWKYLDSGKGYKAWYWFNQNGYITFGWQKVGNTWYYMNRSGEMQTGWQFINNKWYYLNSNGAMATGWVKDGNKWYYMNKDGSMHFGWLSWAGYWYHLDSHGAMSTGWKQVNGKWYYLYAQNGRMAANTTTPDGYRVGADGAWIK